MHETLGLEPGKQWGKYLVRRVIGRGGMGIVYLAVDVNLDREVALKLVRPSMSTDDGLLRQFKQEARAVARLSHPHIVHINAFDQLDDRLLIEMNYLGGGSLQQRLQKGVSLGELLRTLEQTLMALACCHEAGIIHGDVKPANILFSEEGDARLSDFGAARLAQNEWHSTLAQGDSAFVFMGTPQYACPESWDGGDPSPQWDLYSLGMVIREALHGEPLFTAATPYAFLRQVIEKPLAPIKSGDSPISDDLVALLDAMVAKDPKQRPKSAQLCLAALRRTPEYLRSEGGAQPTVMVRRPLPPKPSLLVRAKPTARRAIPWLPLVASILLLAVGASWWSRPVIEMEAEATTVVETPVTPTPVVRPGPQRIALTLPHPSHPGRGYLRALGGGGWRVIIVDSSRILHGEARELPGQSYYEVSGHWAGIEGGVRYGTVTGRAAWDMARPDLLSASLAFRSDTDAGEWQEHMTGVVAEDADPDAWLCRAFDQTPASWGYLYDELMPRSLDFAAPLGELLWESAYLAEIIVRVPSSVDAITADGVFDEPAWQSAERRWADDGDRTAWMKAVNTEEGLALGIRLTDKPPGRAWQLTMRLLPRHRILPAHMPEYEVTVTANRALLTRQTAGGAWRPLEAGLAHGVQTGDESLDIEVMISWEALEGLVEVGGSPPIKVSALVQFGDRPGDRTPVAAWGGAGEVPVSEGLWLALDDAGAAR